MIAISEHTAGDIEKRFGIKGVRVVNPPVDRKSFDQKPAVVEGRFILSLGRLDSRKRIDHLLSAFAQSGYAGDLVIGGTGPELGRLRKMAVELEVENRVRFLGFVSDEVKDSLMQHADAFLLTSEQEGFGITLTEAMAGRTPVIATRCGGPEDIVEDGVTGYLADVGDVDKIASLIDRVTGKDHSGMIEAAYRRASLRKPEFVAGAIEDIHFDAMR